MQLHIYTDGAYSSKTKVGGWGIVVVQDQSNSPYYINSNWQKDTTNNRMELVALLEALKFASKSDFQTIIYTDSAYIASCFSEKWYVKWKLNGWKTAKKTPVLNKDLWEEILTIYSSCPHIDIKKIEGHSNNKWNELADTIAVKARIKGAQIN